MRIRAVTGNYRISTVFGNVPGYPLNNGFHKGVDYVSDNREVVAPQDSKVITRGYDQTNGFYIVLESNGYRDWFSHLVGSSIKVNIGESVKRGQVLATMGNTGYASGIHLHHGLRINGVLVDPELHIGDDMITKKELDCVRIVMSEVEGWNGHDVHAGKYDDKIMGAWEGKEFPVFIRHAWKAQNTHRIHLSDRIGVLSKEVNVGKETIKAQSEVIEMKNKEIESLKAQVGDSSKWETLKALIRELIGR